MYRLNTEKNIQSYSIKYNTINYFLCITILYRGNLKIDPHSKYVLKKVYPIIRFIHHQYIYIYILHSHHFLKCFEFATKFLSINSGGIPNRVNIFTPKCLNYACRPKIVPTLTNTIGYMGVMINMEHNR